MFVFTPKKKSGLFHVLKGPKEVGVNPPLHEAKLRAKQVQHFVRPSVDLVMLCSSSALLAVVGLNSLVLNDLLSRWVYLPNVQAFISTAAQTGLVYLTNMCSR